MYASSMLASARAEELPHFLFAVCILQHLDRVYTGIPSIIVPHPGRPIPPRCATTRKFAPVFARESYSRSIQHAARPLSALARRPQEQLVITLMAPNK